MIPENKPPPIFPRVNDFDAESEENAGTYVSGGSIVLDPPVRN